MHVGDSALLIDCCTAGFGAAALLLCLSALMMLRADSFVNLILHMAVLGPVPTTTALALPAVTTVPCRSQGPSHKAAVKQLPSEELHSGDQTRVIRSEIRSRPENMPHDLS